MQNKYFYTLAFIVSLFCFATINTSKTYAYSEIGAGYTTPNFYSLVYSTLILYDERRRPNNLLDGYALLFHCDLVQESFFNEFEWKKIREKINVEVDNLDKDYHLNYEFGGPVVLEDYNFKTESFALKPDSVLNNVGLLTIFSPPNFQPRREKKYCREHLPQGDEFKIESYLPAKFVVKLQTPIILRALRINSDLAQKFVKEMPGNKSRTVYLRFRVKLNSIEKISKNYKNKYRGLFNAKLIELDVFLDPEFKRFFTKIEL